MDSGQLSRHTACKTHAPIEDGCRGFAIDGPLRDSREDVPHAWRARTCAAPEFSKPSLPTHTLDVALTLLHRPGGFITVHVRDSMQESHTRARAHLNER